MVKILSRGLLKPDDPIFNGGLETFTIRKPDDWAEVITDADYKRNGIYSPWPTEEEDK